MIDSGEGGLIVEPCEYVEKCPIFGRFKDEGIDNIWIRSYCHREAGLACRRKQLRSVGKRPDEIPPDLLPNGEYLATYEHSDRPLVRVKEDDCGHIESCLEFFNEFKEESNRSVWTTRYCFRNHGGDCARKRRIEQEVDLPRNLLPNGDTMS